MGMKTGGIGGPQPESGKKTKRGCACATETLGKRLKYLAQAGFVYGLLAGIFYHGVLMLMKYSYSTVGFILGCIYMGSTLFLVCFATYFEIDRWRYLLPPEKEKLRDFFWYEIVFMVVFAMTTVAAVRFVDSSYSNPSNPYIINAINLYIILTGMTLTYAIAAVWDYWQYNRLKKNILEELSPEELADRARRSRPRSLYDM